MKNNIKLFGTDGIREIAGKYPLDKQTIPKICISSALVFKKVYPKINKLFIGRDTRESSNWIYEIVIKSFFTFGYKIYKLDVFPTPGVAFLSRKYNAIGVVISASHNPFQYNGIKFFSPEGTKLDTEIENKIEEMIKSGLNLKNKNSKSQIIDYSSQGEKEYIDFLRNIFNTDVQINLSTNSNINLVIDCANGSICKIAQKFFSSLPLKCTFLNINPDGKNINQSCGAVFPENVKKHLNKKSIGISFDGDGDRVIFIDEKKNIRDGDYILGILATEYKKNKKLNNCLVIPTLMSNLALIKYLWSKGIKTIPSLVGDKYVYQYMRTYNATLGGEQSGHIIISNYLPTGDGMITSIEILKIVLTTNTPLYKLSSIFTKYPQVIKNIKLSNHSLTNEEKETLIKEIFPQKIVKQHEKKIQGRILIRWSGTEPILRIMVEGKNNSSVNKTASFLEKHFLDKIKNNNLT